MTQSISKNEIDFKLFDNVYSNFVQITFLVKVGSFDEKTNELGITHLIEHLMFRNLGGMKQKELYLTVDKMGADFSANTFREYVEFSIRVRKEYVIKSFEILIKIFDKPSWSLEEINKEKKVVINQINMNDYAGGTPFEIGYYFWDTLYSNQIMGSIESVYQLNQKQLLRWHKKYFCIKNTEIFIVGNLNENDKNTIRKTLNDLPFEGERNNAEYCILPKHFCERNDNSHYIYNADDDYAQVNIVFDVKHSPTNYYSTRVLKSIIGEGLGSMLNVFLREDLGLSSEIETFYNEYKGFTSINIKVTVDNQDLISTIDAISDTIEFVKYNLSKDDVSRVINFYRNQKEIFTYDVESYSNYIKWEKILYCRWFENTNEWIDSFNAISDEDIVTEAYKVFSSKNVSFYISNNSKIICEKRLISKLKEFRATI